MPYSPTEYSQSVSHRELQKNYGIVPHSPMELPTEYNPSVSHRELQKNYGIVPHSPTGLPTFNTDGITDELRTSRSARMSDMCPSAHIPMAVPTSITDGFTHFSKRTHV